MTVADIARRYGTWSLAGFAVCLVTWLILAAIRAPFVLVVRLLAAAQQGIDARMTDRLTASAASSQSWRSTHV